MSFSIFIIIKSVCKIGKIRLYLPNLKIEPLSVKVRNCNYSEEMRVNIRRKDVNILPGVRCGGLGAGLVLLALLEPVAWPAAHCFLWQGAPNWTTACFILEAPQEPRGRTRGRSRAADQAGGAPLLGSWSGRRSSAPRERLRPGAICLYRICARTDGGPQRESTKSHPRYWKLRKSRSEKAPKSHPQY